MSEELIDWPEIFYPVPERERRMEPVDWDLLPGGGGVFRQPSGYVSTDLHKL